MACPSDYDVEVQFYVQNVYQLWEELVHEGDVAMESEKIDWEPELLVDQEEEMVEQVTIVAKKATL
ncbi:hypothetical protein DAPPUDRAFT_322641 [Daphnia pulex]|uniref:Uncharacterized protein n=1 Tax=Daphnia pulex TaxID=6669 RepID=E9GWL0_DAPPU|nr:hypothetical protein DAPPUDRAFT_322641 [Daphnia pulex]|eukprot:EFX76120.1 hypothetical protein DAPPUDRAFT_322641 [Daphnia pulex]